jgi:hypothetical protein
VIAAAAPPPIYPWPIGIGARYHPTPANARVARGSAFGRFRCGNGRTFAVHIELFAMQRVVIVPPGIGIARGGCRYQVRTTTPTGVVEVARTGRWTLGDVFAVWGRRLSSSRLLSFRGPVSVYVGGRRWSGDPRLVPLSEHGQIVVEIGGYVAPHPSYLFPKGPR